MLSLTFLVHQPLLQAIPVLFFLAEAALSAIFRSKKGFSVDGVWFFAAATAVAFIGMVGMLEDWHRISPWSSIIVGLIALVGCLICLLAGIMGLGMTISGNTAKPRAQLPHHEGPEMMMMGIFGTISCLVYASNLLVLAGIVV